MCSSMCSGSIGIILFCIIFFIYFCFCHNEDKNKYRDEVSKLEEEKRWLVRYIHALDKKVEENWKLERYIKYLEKKVDILEHKNKK